MLPNNLITYYILLGLIGSIYGYLLCWLAWTLTDMDLAWYEVKRLTRKLEDALRETEGKNKLVDDLLERHTGTQVTWYDDIEAYERDIGHKIATDDTPTAKN